MKKATLVTALAALLLVAGCSTTHSLETTALHPEKHTLRFVWVSGEGKLFETIDSFLDTLNGTQEIPIPQGWSTESLSTTPVPPMHTALPMALEKADTKYTELFSSTVDMGGEFSSADSSLKGKVWKESEGDRNTLTSFTLKLPDHDLSTTQEDFKLKPKQWNYIVFGPTDVKILMIKLYDPQASDS